jgi:hypothetical protein
MPAVTEQRQRGTSIRVIAEQLGVGTVTRTLLERSRYRSEDLEQTARIEAPIRP